MEDKCVFFTISIWIKLVPLVRWLASLNLDCVKHDFDTSEWYASARPSSWNLWKVENQWV